MRFKLTLLPAAGKTAVPFNYQYALSAIIYGKIAQANQAYAEFLHEKGYALNDYSKHFKFFTFSNLAGKFAVQQGALQLQSPETGFLLCCHTPEFAENLIKGVFADQEINIVGKGAKAVFNVSQIQLISPLFDADDDNALHTIHFKLLSPLVVGRKNEKGNDDYLSPEHADFLPLLTTNLVDKLTVIYGEYDADKISITAHYTREKIKSRLVTIKEGTDAETRVRGFTGFTLELTATGRVIELALDAGLGSMNGVGFGCVRVF